MNNPGWFVYMVCCQDKSLYTGVTTDVERRAGEHNSANKGARYTRARQPVELVYYEAAESRSLACRRESEIKRLSRKAKLALISSTIINT
ncbi:GIY-YIG nuclease family protein [Teredinibacter haidensis]|uniref:GIY-YIG nuclease family protein n=1 Tax=Teredinibacter haidensis TaxID=2731755 RepID=UPI000948924A|nr:GIY-YIG nuclease family protein [Teredinibacter haidensis]